MRLEFIPYFMHFLYNDESLPHIIVVGGGFAGLEFVKAIRHKPYRVTLFDTNNYHTFQPMLYQVASGGIGPDGIAYPLRKIISKFPNIAFRMAEVIEVFPIENRIHTSIGDFSYDHLVIASGAQTNFFGNNQLQQHTMQLKSIPDALDLRSNLLQEFEKAITLRGTGKEIPILNFVVVGGGPTGVETSGALAEIKKNILPADYNELNASLMQVHLVESSSRLLVAMSEKSSEAALRALLQLGVQVRLNTAVTGFDGEKLTLSTGETLNTETVIWAAGVKGKVLKGIAEKAIGHSNRYITNGFLQIEGYSNIYALGDIACMKSDPKFPHGHPMVCTPAIQQGKYLAGNFNKLVKGKAVKPFHYFHPGSMATVGRHKAVMEIFGFRFKGLIAWFGWMFLHLMWLVGFRNRVIVFVNWMWNYLTYQRAIRLITRPYFKKGAAKNI